MARYLSARRQGPNAASAHRRQLHACPTVEPFKDFDQFRDLLCSDPRPIARNFAEKLLVYGTGAPISFADRAVVEEIVDQTCRQNFGLRSLLHAVVVQPHLFE